MIDRKQKSKEMNALVLAFLGDAVYNLKVKEQIVKRVIAKAGELNKIANKYVRAKKQADVFDIIFSTLSRDEQNVASRAKNIHTTNVPKSSTLEEYKKATSLEAVVGFNYLCENFARIDEIISIVIGEDL